MLQRLVGVVPVAVDRAGGIALLRHVGEKLLQALGRRAVDPQVPDERADACAQELAGVGQSLQRLCAGVAGFLRGRDVGAAVGEPRVDHLAERDLARSPRSGIERLCPQRQQPSRSLGVGLVDALDLRREPSPPVPPTWPVRPVFPEGSFNWLRRAGHRRFAGPTPPLMTWGSPSVETTGLEPATPCLQIDLGRFFACYGVHAGTNSCRPVPRKCPGQQGFTCPRVALLHLSLPTSIRRVFARRRPGPGYVGGYVFAPCETSKGSADKNAWRS